MPETLSADQVRKKYIAAMGEQFGEAFCDLFNHVASLFSKWSDYVTLFGHNGTVDLLNQTAPTLFHDLQLILRESILLHLCRLTDKPKTRGQDNLTICRIHSLIPACVSTSFQSAVASAVDDAVTKTEFARVWRNKHLAHTNLAAAAGGTADVLPAAGKTEIKSALESIGKVFNCVELHYLKSEIAWGLFDDPPHGALRLLHYLRKGFDAQKCEDDDIRRHMGGK